MEPVIVVKSFSRRPFQGCPTPSIQSGPSSIHKCWTEPYTMGINRHRSHAIQQPNCLRIYISWGQIIRGFPFAEVELTI